MLYITEISECKKHLRVIYSLERPDIEFQWDIGAVINGLEKGHKYKTAYSQNGNLGGGANVDLIIDGNHSYLRTSKNSTIEDNLGNLPTFIY